MQQCSVCAEVGLQGRIQDFKVEEVQNYAVKAQMSLAPLSRFCGSRITTAHAHQCCRFQSYAKNVPSQMKLTKREPINIPGIHNGPRDHCM